jgi:hypothetical protein
MHVFSSKNINSTRVLVINPDEWDRGLVKSMIFLMRIVNRKLVIVEIMAAAICRPFSTYSFLKIYWHSCCMDGSEKLNRLLLQKHVTNVWLVEVLAYVYDGIVIWSQLTELTLMKMLHNDTSVVQMAINTKMMIIAKVTLKILLHIPISRLSQLIYSGSLTLSLIIRS